MANVIQTPRSILPSTWSDSLMLDYLDRAETINALINGLQHQAQQIDELTIAVRDLIERVEALENAVP